MDVLEQVRDIDRDDAPVQESQLTVARQALMREIAREVRAPRRTRRRWIGVTALVGGVAATAIAITVIAPAQIDPAAAAVLENAADVTITAVDTTLAPGQYLRIQTDTDTLWQWDVGMGDPSARFNNGNRADTEAGLVVRDTRVLYVPADRSTDWVWDWSAHGEVIDTYGDRADEAISDWTAFSTGSNSGYWGDVQILPGGEVQAAPSDDHEYLLDSYRPLYGEMPRDPQLLLDWFRDRSGDPDVADQWVVGAITDVLSANLMPADLRAALLRALARIPGIQVEAVDGDLTTLAYQSSDWLSTRVTEITIDTTQGMITAVAQTTIGLGGSGMLPSTVPDGRTTVTTTVVDTAPVP